jgi:hypothetical protein
MLVEFKVPWEKYGTISYLAKAMECYNVQFGKTSLQKIVDFRKLSFLYYQALSRGQLFFYLHLSLLQK